MNNSTVERILFLLEKSGTEQKDLAHFLGVKAQTVSDWKSGKTQSYKKHIDKIAEYFNVSVDYLLERTDDPAPKNYINGNNNIQAINNGKNLTVNTTTKSNDLIEDFMKIFDGLSSENKIKLMYSAIELKNKGE